MTTKAAVQKERQQEQQQLNQDRTTRPVQISKALSEVIGGGQQKDLDVIAEVWRYIGKHDLLLDEEDGKRLVRLDENLKSALGCEKESISLAEMTNLLKPHNATAAAN